MAKSRDTRRLLDGIIQIDRMLRLSEYPKLSRIAVELEASERTVQRYIEFMRDRLGVEVVYDKKRRGYGYADKALSIPNPQLTDGELVALYIAKPLLEEYRGTSLEQYFQRAFEKITCQLPNRIQTELSVLPKQVSRHRRWPAKNEVETFETLLSALRKNCIVSMDYQNVTQQKPETRQVHPYRLHFYNDRWYLIAYCCMREDVRVFQLDRIKRLNSLQDTFNRPIDFTLEQYFSDSLGVYRGAEDGSTKFDYVIRFDAFAARFVQGLKYHKTQECHELPDGSLEMTLTIDASVEIEEFLLSFGEHAELLSPPSARKNFKARLQRVLACYE
ncbi:MAG: WYL domain-containing transcriptional regulator [Planctomycetota bacterium]|nr:WYL domain-containing transcriptional regulator [Planctomycetota bacterium]